MNVPDPSVAVMSRPSSLRWRPRRPGTRNVPARPRSRREGAHGQPHRDPSPGNSGPESVMQYRLRVQAFWACTRAVGAGRTGSNPGGFLHNANFV